MAWPNPFRKRTPNTRTCWGYTFDLGPDHLTLEQAEPLKHSYDVLGEEALDVLNELYPRDSTIFHPPSNDKDSSSDAKTKPKRDLYLLLRDNHDKHPKLQEIWDQVNTIPEWVDWDQIARGQDVFYRYGGANLTGESIFVSCIVSNKA